METQIANVPVADWKIDTFKDLLTKRGVNFEIEDFGDGVKLIRVEYEDGKLEEMKSTIHTINAIATGELDQALGYDPEKIDEIAELGLKPDPEKDELP